MLIPPRNPAASALAELDRAVRDAIRRRKEVPPPALDKHTAEGLMAAADICRRIMGPNCRVLLAKAMDELDLGLCDENDTTPQSSANPQAKVLTPLGMAHVAVAYAVDAVNVIASILYTCGAYDRADTLLRDFRKDLQKLSDFVEAYHGRRSAHGVH